MEISKTQERFCNLALYNAINNFGTKFSHGAILVKAGKIMGYGVNTPRTRFAGKNHPSMHAEISVLRNISTRKRSRLLWG